MNTKFRIALALSGLFLSAQAAAQVTFYESESFQGRSFTTQQRVSDFQRYGFNDRASSASVVGNRWEVCTDSRYGGNCAVLRPGNYPSLASLGLGDRISSARALDANVRIDENRYAPMPAAAQKAQVTFFENESFQGRSFTSSRPVPNFDRYGFNDRASSAEVVGERWEVCEDRSFKGNCRVLRPGRYPSLRAMGMNERISSVRVLNPNARIDDNRYAPAYAEDASARRDFSRRDQERVYQANVTSARAVVGTPEQRCWIEKEQVAQPASGVNTTGMVAGALIGGILGHELVDGKNRNLATAGGAVAGGFAGANIDRITGKPVPQVHDVQKCENVQSRTPTYWDVSYNFRGQEHRMQTTTQPGATVTVNEQGEPRT
jgi:uncharacterized protein YcfJ